MAAIRHHRTLANAPTGARRSARLAIAARALVVGLGLLVAGCNATTTVYNDQVYHDRWRDAFAGPPASEFLLDIAGHPFLGQETQTETVIEDVVALPFNNDGYRFTTTPKAINPLTPYLSIVFNAEIEATGIPCSDVSRLRFSPAADGRIAVQAALCRHGGLLTRADGVASGVTGPDDPKFRELMFQVSRKLFATSSRG